ncbi:hypothetical protein BURKHO8Y_260004 [Burkholderia sp. 8Y]|nr:hypothetical protein BURKHO8Y_260004 [Burkholderia sp. 8Y]
MRAKLDASPPPALCSARRRIVIGLGSLGRLQTGLLAPRAGTISTVSATIPRAIAGCLNAGALRFFSSLAHLSDRREFARYLSHPRTIDWVVYAKEPFGGPQQVLDYLGRYTHRVAISNNRLLDVDDEHITFRWKDYRQPGKPRAMRLQAHEFVRRFLLHVLPLGLQRIRHYGLLSNRLRASRLAECRRLLHAPPAAEAATKSQAGYRERSEVLTSRSLYRCPVCAQGQMVCVECLSAGALPRAPPLSPA